MPPFIRRSRQRYHRGITLVGWDIVSVWNAVGEPGEVSMLRASVMVGIDAVDRMFVVDNVAAVIAAHAATPAAHHNQEGTT